MTGPGWFFDSATNSLVQKISPEWIRKQEKGIKTMESKLDKKSADIQLQRKRLDRLQNNAKNEREKKAVRKSFQALEQQREELSEEHLWLNDMQQSLARDKWRFRNQQKAAQQSKTSRATRQQPAPRYASAPEPKKSTLGSFFQSSKREAPHVRQPAPPPISSGSFSFFGRKKAEPVPPPVAPKKKSWSFFN